MQKTILMIFAVVMGQSVLAADKKPLIADPIVEKAIRNSLKKPEGALTKADLEKVTWLSLTPHWAFKKLNHDDYQLTDVKGLEKLTQLTGLRISGR